MYRLSKQMVENVLNEMTADKQRHCVEHVIEEEEDKQCQFDNITIIVLHNLSINTDDNSDSRFEVDMQGIKLLSDQLIVDSTLINNSDKFISSF